MSGSLATRSSNLAPERLRTQEAAFMTDNAARMLANLPSVFRNSDRTGDLARLLAVFEAYFFAGGTVDGCSMPGLEQYLEQIPEIFSPVTAEQYGPGPRHTPERFIHWLADCFSFSPHPLFSTDVLRRVLSAIVPLYGLRGTKVYLERLLGLCFADEIAGIHIDDRPTVGFTIGSSTLGVDTRLAASRPFYFRVVIECYEPPRGSDTPYDAELLSRRLHAVIDFAKPAHTIYELECRMGSRVVHASGSVRH